MITFFFSDKVINKVIPNSRKDYCTAYTMPEKMLNSPKLFEEVLKVWRASIPLNRFIQRAMEDVKGV